MCGGIKRKKLSLKPLKAQKRREAMGASSQQGGARVVEVEVPMLRESRERTSFLQLFSHPVNVTREALKRAARLTARRDLAERIPSVFK